ncbi:MAG: hypothetical protein ABEK50_18820 [bacterium]
MSRKGKMSMPMMHRGMSGKEMDRYCQGMNQWHDRMMKTRRKNSEQLNALVGKMKQARGNEKMEAIEAGLVEMVEQHNNRRRMMGTMGPRMMNAMLGMHRMSKQNREQMMDRLESCPFFQREQSGDK